MTSELQIQAFEYGASDYLIKPLRKNEVLTLWQVIQARVVCPYIRTHEPELNPCDFSPCCVAHMEEQQAEIW